MWLEETKIKPFGVNSNHRAGVKKKDKRYTKNTTPTVKHVGGNVLEVLFCKGDGWNVLRREWRGPCIERF